MTIESNLVYDWLGNVPTPIEPHHRPFYQNQAALLQHNGPESPEVRRKKEKQAVSALHKVTDPNPESCRKLGVYRSPFGTIPHEYWRCMEAVIHALVTKRLADILGMSPREVHPIRNRLFREVTRRELPHPNLQLNIDSPQKFAATIDTIAGLVKEGKLPAYEVPLDFSDYLETSKRHPKQIVQEFEEIVRSKVAQIQRECPHLDLQKLTSNLALRAFTKVEGQEVYLSPFFLAENKQAQLDFQDNLVWRISSQGYRLSPHELFTLWLGIETLPSILANNRLPLASLSSPYPVTITSLQQFLDHNDVAAFAELSTLPDAPPYLQVYPEATCSLIRGFRDFEIDSTFKSKGLDRLLHYFYSQMLSSMQVATEHKDDIVAFLSQYELMHLMIQYIVDWVEPYTGKDFRDAVIARLERGPRPILPPGLDMPLVHLKASASNGLSSILGAVEAQKGHNELGVLVLKDCYYTISDNVFNRTTTYSVSILDGGSATIHPLPSKPIDLFVCEFNHNANPNRHIYRQENLLEHVRQLVERKLLSDQSTIVIDNTIDLDQSQALHDFLADPLIKGRIFDGKLNVVLLRSALKFDMLELDNYYGGITTSINKHAAFTRYNARMDLPEDQLKGLDLQGLTHIQKHAPHSIDKSIQLYMKTTKFILDNIPKECFYSPDSKNPLQISKMKDGKKSIFIHFKFHPDFPESEQTLFEIAPDYAFQRGGTFVERASFSFGITSCYVDKKRFNVGLENPDRVLWLSHLATDVQGITNLLGKKITDAKLAAGIRNLVKK